MSRCCLNCFSDAAIKEKIQRDGQIGRCSYCNSNSVIAIEPHQLANLFDLLTDCITPVESGGKNASLIFDEEFRVFDDSVRDKELLLKDILGEDFNEIQYVLIYDTDSYVDSWSPFKNELIHNNRFFPKHELFSTVFSQSNTHESNGSNNTQESITFTSLIGDLGTIRYINETFYRARISEEKLEPDNMGMPPAKQASAGRANPQGIAYLYLADNIGTCIQEVRPSNGAIINISAFTATRDLNFIDLTDPKKTVSLLKYEENEIHLILQFMNWLELFSEELSKPVLPEKSHLEYIPTQFVCEYIKAIANIDGIIFSSSYGSGNNLVLFHSEGFDVASPTLYEVDSVTVDFSQHD